MPATDKVDAILARFPGPVTMPVDRRKALAVLLGSLAFVAIGILILRYGDGEADEIFWAWAAMIFFGLCAAVAAVMLLPGAGSLTLAARPTRRGGRRAISPSEPGAARERPTRSSPTRTPGRPALRPRPAAAWSAATRRCPTPTGSRTTSLRAS